MKIVHKSTVCVRETGVITFRMIVEKFSGENSSANWEKQCYVETITHFPIN